MKRLNSLMPIITLIAIILVSFSASCDKRNPPPIIPAPPVPPNASDIRIITRITATPDTIYADNNVTYSEIHVEVKDGEGFGVRGQMVLFRTDIGRVVTNVATDSTGVAKSLFWDAGDSGRATITAIVRKFQESNPDSLLSADTTQVYVQIDQIPPIQSVALEVNNTPNLGNPYEMKVAQQIPVSAKAYLGSSSEETQAVPNNSLITFTCTTGRFFDSQGNDLGQETVAKTFNGKATVQYNSGTQANTSPGSTLANITARIGGVADARQIRISPGSPSSIELLSFLNINGQDEPSITSEVGSPYQIFMVATLKDMYFNECQNQRVDFRTDLGTFLNTAQTIALNTDSAGKARVRFTPGLSAGAATIRASANNDTLNTQLIFTIASDDVYSMDFTQEEAINLNVANTGGASSAILRVKLRDINYNLVDSPYEVSFKIVNNNPPTGANLNNRPVTEWVTVTSNGGEAQVSVNAGSESGVLVIQARCINSAGVNIEATKPNVIIHAGPPHTITPFMGGYNTGAELQGGVWRVVAGAHVRDMYNNPVSRNTAVWFSIKAYDQGTNAQIQATGTVGNVSVEGDSLEGVAYTIVTYHGSQTNNRIRISASSGNTSSPGSDFPSPWEPDYIEGLYTEMTTVFPLPLNSPNLYLDTDPGAVHFGLNNPDTKEANILVTLLDGQGVPVTKSQIMLSSSRGQIVYHTDYLHVSEQSSTAPIIVTPNYQSVHPSGPLIGTLIANRVFTNNGAAFGRVKTWRIEYPPALDAAAGPLESVMDIQGWIVGTTEQPGSTTLSVWSHPGAAPF